MSRKDAKSKKVFLLAPLRLCVRFLIADKVCWASGQKPSFSKELGFFERGTISHSLALQHGLTALRNLAQRSAKL